MASRPWSGQRIAGVAGIGFFILFAVVIMLGFDSPVYDDPVADVRGFFVDSDTQVHLVTWLGGLGFVFFFLPFAAGLRSLLASAEGADFWSRLSFTGAVIAAAIGGAGSAFWEVLSQGIAEGASDDTLLAIARLDTVTFAALVPWALALFAGAASVVILRSGVLARWLGWVGAAAALLSVVGSLWIFAEDDEAILAFVAFIGLAVGALWVLAVGIVMLRRDAHASVPGTGH